LSEQGWRGFLAADGLDDWVVLHGGAAAVFRVTSLTAAAQLAQAVAGMSGFEGSGALLTIADGHLSVRMTRGVMRIEPRHVEVARAISAIAREHGAIANRTAVQEVQVLRPVRVQVWRESNEIPGRTLMREGAWLV
jgi:4a-hydroxytetrahydrobiopterin dehydratase